ncbi:hypothetical protein HU200_034400 [Digitaria exilis]|uniref:non-specific serine/threonine protein kinase n=1 Tax=Digitaria exilis TaxID=1010633 RepID=A0A835BQA9_9POAL|nr:hypothetical protein HU200_034400 [Digitaria exilis]
MPNSPNLLTIAILLLSATPAPSAGDRSFCTDATYERNSTYKANLRSLAGALVSDAARLHSATGAAGEGPDRVYGAVLCRADSTGADCAGRLRNAIGVVIDDGDSTSGNGDASCALRRDVAVYSELYQLRFSDEDFLANFSNAPEWADVTNPDTVPSAVAARFDEGVTELLSTLADDAARRPERWAVGVAPWSSSSSGEKDRAVYGLAQCSQDMPPDRCRACLDGVVAERSRKIGGGKMGGAVFGARCTLRYEMDVQFFNVTGDSRMMSLRKKKDRRALVITATVYTSAVLCTRLFFWLLSIWMKRKRSKNNSMEEPENMDEVLRLWRIEDTSLDFSLYDFSQIADATDNFSPEKLLGEGGFGPVYKGVFPDGQVVAIKRLSARSRQGLIEFKNEIQVIAKLQHKNLVRLLGCCIYEEEKMLIYEYLANKSLDHFIFDPIRRESLKWKSRIKIADASNILLDSDLNPKISDFGMARIFPVDATQATASRLVGTFGYMAPEYASDGLLSIKSDVFSFGVLLLEIISGKRSSGFQYNGEFYNLLEYAWQLWKGRRWNEFIDKSFGDEYEMEELMKYLAVALLCVQEKTIDRPTMHDVIAILSSENISLPEPKQPAYSYAKLDVSVNATVLSSRNDVTITTTTGR